MVFLDWYTYYVLNHPSFTATSFNIKKTLFCKNIGEIMVLYTGH